MSQRNLESAVANATGEDIHVIRRRGFSVIDLQQEYFDAEPDQLLPQMIDWDENEPGLPPGLHLPGDQSRQGVSN